MAIFKHFVKLIGPDTPAGRTIMRTRMFAQTLPLRLSKHREENRDFLKLCRRIIPRYSMMSVDRLHSIDRISSNITQNGIGGSIVECGTWNGGAAAVMARASQRSGMIRDLWLFDSFEGLPPPTPEDPPIVHRSWHKGWCTGDPAKVREVLLAEDTPDDCIHIVKGWFESTFPQANVGPIALLHIDSDWYESVRICLDTFFDSVVPGGAIVFDDYQLWGGCRKAVDEFLNARNLQKSLKPSGKSAVYMIKPGLES